MPEYVPLAQVRLRAHKKPILVWDLVTSMPR